MALEIYVTVHYTQQKSVHMHALFALLPCDSVIAVKALSYSNYIPRGIPGLRGTVKIH